MNAKVMKGLIFAGGAVCGSVVTLFTMKKQYQEKLFQSVNEMRDFYEEKLQEACDAMAVLGETSMDNPEEVTPNRPERSVKIPDGSYNAEEIIEKMNYNQFSYKEKSTEKEEPKVMSQAELISLDEFYEGDGYDQEELTYFQKDDVFINLDDEIVEVDRRIVTYEDLERFGDGEEPDLLCLRYPEEGLKYKIVLEEDQTIEEYMQMM